MFNCFRVKVNSKEKELKSIESKYLNQILLLIDKYKLLSNEELNLKVQLLNSAIKENNNIEPILIEAVSTCVEVTNRYLRKDFTKNDILTGLLLFKGKLVNIEDNDRHKCCIIPFFLNCLLNKKCAFISIDNILNEIHYNDLKKLFNLLKIKSLKVDKSNLSNLNALDCNILFLSYEDLLNTNELTYINYAFIDNIDTLLYEFGYPIANSSKSIYTNIINTCKDIGGVGSQLKNNEKMYKDIFNRDVISLNSVYTNLRKDRLDKIYTSNELKLKAIIDDIKTCHKKNRPILLASNNIETLDLISTKLKEYNITHKLLIGADLYSEIAFLNSCNEIGCITLINTKLIKYAKVEPNKDTMRCGGLKVIGIERSFYRDLDNNLINITAQYGSNGSSQFYLSTEDELMKNVIKNNKTLLIDLNKKYLNSTELRLIHTIIEVQQKNNNLNISY